MHNKTGTMVRRKKKKNLEANINERDNKNINADKEKKKMKIKEWNLPLKILKQKYNKRYKNNSIFPYFVKKLRKWGNKEKQNYSYWFYKWRNLNHSLSLVTKSRITELKLF